LQSTQRRNPDVKFPRNFSNMRKSRVSAIRSARIITHEWRRYNRSGAEGKRELDGDEYSAWFAKVRTGQGKDAAYTAMLKLRVSAAPAA
jgi:hypothetical protein